MKTIRSITQTFRDVLEDPQTLPPAAQAYALVRAFMALDALTPQYLPESCFRKDATQYLDARRRVRDYAFALATFFEGDGTLSATWKARRVAENALTKIDRERFGVRPVSASLELLLLANEIAEPVRRSPDSHLSKLVYTLGANCLEATAEGRYGSRLLDDDLRTNAVYTSQADAVGKHTLRALRRIMVGRDPENPAWQEHVRQRFLAAISYAKNWLMRDSPILCLLKDIEEGLVLHQHEFTRGTLDEAVLEVAKLDVGHGYSEEMMGRLYKPLTAAVRGYLMGLGDTTQDDPARLLRGLDDIELRIQMERIAAEEAERNPPD